MWMHANATLVYTIFSFTRLVCPESSFAQAQTSHVYEARFYASLVTVAEYVMMMAGLHF